jgi:hypothetical protein
METLVTKKHVVSKKRVADHGEVYTQPREVAAMLDLVKHETERIDSRFLEPACGHGNFLAEILRRKLDVVHSRYRKSLPEFERYTLLAVASIYGIDILEDNVLECRKRLFGIVEARFKRLFRDPYLSAIQFIIERNIIWGDALSLQTVEEKPKPIVFSEWSLVKGSMVKRRDFTFHELLSYGNSRQGPLFSDLGEEIFFPEPVKEYPLIHYWKLADAEGD